MKAIHPLIFFLKRFTAADNLSAKLAALASLLLVIPVSATTITPPEFSELVNRADYVVRAVVKSVRSELTSLPNGHKIHTYVELDVVESIAGTPPSPLVLRLLGGKVGELEMVLQGAPKFHVGEEHILFVRGNGRLAYPLVGLMHGQYPIKRDEAANRRYMARSDGLPLLDTVEVSQAIREGAAFPELLRARIRHALTPKQFSQQIKAVSKHPARRASQ